MLDTTARAEPASLFHDKPLCEHCRKPFEPRQGRGGEPQRFCGPECRRSFHNAHRVPPPPTAIAENMPAVVEQPQPKPAPAVSAEDSNGFDWINEDNEDVVLREQQAIALYLNPYGGLVIRQHEEGWPQGDDTVIVINRENIRAFVDRLNDIARAP